MRLDTHVELNTTVLLFEGRVSEHYKMLSNAEEIQQKLQIILVTKNKQY